MTPRVIIPTDSPDAESIAEHFGRATYFAVFDLDGAGKVISSNIQSNTGSHRGGRGHAHDNILGLNPNVIIVRGMGPRGIQSFQDANVAVLRANSNVVDRTLDAYNKGELDELTEGCADAHHK